MWYCRNLLDFLNILTRSIPLAKSLVLTRYVGNTTHLAVAIGWLYIFWPYLAICNTSSWIVRRASWMRLHFPTHSCPRWGAHNGSNMFEGKWSLLRTTTSSPFTHASLPTSPFQIATESREDYTEEGLWMQSYWNSIVNSGFPCSDVLSNNDGVTSWSTPKSII